MTQILVVGSEILAVAPLTDTGNNIVSSDAIYPKTSMPGWFLTDMALPADFAPHKYQLSGNQLVVRTLPAELAAAQATQTALISQACQNAIYAGFTSSALGAAHTYPAKDLDQQNLTASVLSSLMPGLSSNWTTPFWCADANGNWAYVQHTAAQIQQVGVDGKAAILICLTKNQTLAAQIAAATTVAQVQAIVWS
jgi:hypothetical protein